jgi:hypothetical protein
LFFYFFDSCLEEFSSSWLIRAVEILNETGLLTRDAGQTNFNAVAGHHDPSGVADVLRALNAADLLTTDAAQANRDVVAGHRDPSCVAQALRTLRDEDLLTGDAAQANFNAVVGHRDPRGFASALGTLNCVGLLTGDVGQANRDAVVSCQNPRWVVDALCVLNSPGLLKGDAAQANFNAVVGHRDPRGVAWVLRELNRVGLLTGDVGHANRDAVADYQNSSMVAGALFALDRAGLLTGDVGQANFNTLMMHSAILCHAEMPEFWSRVPGHLFTQARFAALIDICQRHADNPAAGCALVIAYINREILGIHEPAAGGPRLNARQSTHTASVHQSVSDSATRLMEKYGDQISGRLLDIMIQELSAWLNAQPDLSRQVIKAKLCLQRLTTTDYCFIDPSSQVSMKQLLALFWIAIHDDARRQGTLDDAKSQLIEGLYEIQREYNLSATGKDNGADHDIPSCPSGTFNKMIEKGQGVHPDMVIDFISMAGFSLKIPLVVNEVAMAYLKSLDILNLRSLIDAIKAAENANSVGPIWAEIRAVVAERMFNEFGSLFRNDGTTREFLIAIAAGEFCPLNPNHLSELDRLIGQVSQDGAAAASLGTAPDGFFADAAATAGTNDNATASAASAPRP